MDDVDARVLGANVAVSECCADKDNEDTEVYRETSVECSGDAVSRRRQLWTFVALAVALFVTVHRDSMVNLIDDLLPAVPVADLGKDIEYFVTSRGFELELHELTTEDGYIITFHQVFHKNFSDTYRPAVVFGLPLSGSSTVFVLDNSSMAFQFAAAGFDVWLTNGRGNSFGQRHVSLDPEKDRAEFFDYTYVEQGELDIAAHIDYIIQYTQQTKVFYVGVSQGAASYFALLSKRPEYNEKIEKAVSYGGFRSICFATDPSIYMVSKLAWPFGDFVMPFVGSMMWTMPVLSNVCSRVPRLCAGYFLHGMGFRSEYYLKMSRMPVYLEHFPNGTSFKNLLLYTQSRQIGCDGTAREFDHDSFAWTKLKISLGLASSENQRRYGTREAPLLDPSNIRVPTKLYYSDGDELAPPREVLKVAEDVGIPVENLHRISDLRFSHFHFVLNTRRNDFIQHSIDFFRGINSTWPLSEQKSEGWRS